MEDHRAWTLHGVRRTFGSRSHVYTEVLHGAPGLAEGEKVEVVPATAYRGAVERLDAAEAALVLQLGSRKLAEIAIQRRLEAMRADSDPRGAVGMDGYRAQRDAAIRRGVNAVQEEFDERGLGKADLLVSVIVDESGLVEQLAGAVDLIEQARGCVAAALNCTAHPWHGSDQARRWLMDADRLGGR